MAMRFQPRSRARCSLRNSASSGSGKRRKRKPFASNRDASELVVDELLICAMIFLAPLTRDPRDQGCFVCVRRAARKPRATTRTALASCAVFALMLCLDAGAPDFLRAPRQFAACRRRIRFANRRRGRRESVFVRSAGVCQLEQPLLGVVLGFHRRSLTFRLVGLGRDAITAKVKNMLQKPGVPIYVKT